MATYMTRNNYTIAYFLLLSFSHKAAALDCNSVRIVIIQQASKKMHGSFQYRCAKPISCWRAVERCRLHHRCPIIESPTRKVSTRPTIYRQKSARPAAALGGTDFYR